MRVISALALLAACSGGSAGAPASGTVTVDGKPAKVTACALVPAGDDTALAFTLADGTVLTTTDDGLDVRRAGALTQVSCGSVSREGTSTSTGSSGHARGHLTMDCGAIQLDVRYDCRR